MCSPTEYVITRSPPAVRVTVMESGSEASANPHCKSKPSILRTQIYIASHFSQKWLAR